EQAWRREHIALCFTITLSNGSLPLPDDNPWLVLVSDFPSLQIDEGPWLGEKLENIPPIIYTTNGKAKVFHKVYIGNMSHAMHAYIGSALGMDYLDEGIMENEWAQYNIAKAREEATLAVTSEFTFSDYELNEWENEPPMSAKVQHDPFSRIGNSPEKKAGYNERYIWPARMCLKHGRLPYYLCMGAAYCLFYIVTGHGKQPVERPANEEEVRALVERFCGLGDEDFIVRDLVVAQYCAIPEAGIIPTEK
ncbi:MAG: hypothetical protein IJH87_03460, partial [Atopobiaceae bacterium]|nr:hypothetical protein [Atopobiaceae bacterium]